MASMHAFPEVMPRNQGIYQETAYPEIREFLGQEYQALPDEYIEQIVAENFGENVDPGDIEGFFSSVGNFVKKAAKTVAQVAPAVLPAVTTVAGTALGGPIGGVLGGAVGSAVGGALGKAVAPRVKQAAKLPASAAKTAQQVGTIAGTLPATGRSAAKLLQTLLQPKVINSLQAMALGKAGKKNISVGGATVPVSAFANLIGLLANQVSEEAHANRIGEPESNMSYLLNEEGIPIVDPASPEQRASVLLNLLQQENLMQAYQESNGFQSINPNITEFSDGQRYMDDYYDMLELASFYDELDEEEGELY